VTTTPSNVLWSAREAALKLGYAPRTAQRVAKEHFEAGDPNLVAVSKSFVASPDRWKEVLSKTRGRRRNRYDPDTGERLPPGVEPL